MEGEYPGQMTGVLSLFRGALAHLRIRILPVPGIEGAGKTVSLPLPSNAEQILRQPGVVPADKTDFASPCGTAPLPSPSRGRCRRSRRMRCFLEANGHCADTHIAVARCRTCRRNLFCTAPCREWACPFRFSLGNLAQYIAIMSVLIYHDINKAQLSEIIIL